MFLKNRRCLNVVFVKIANVILKGIVSRDFQWLQMILVDVAWVPDVPLKVYYFFNLCFHVECKQF